MNGLHFRFRHHRFYRQQFWLLAVWVVFSLALVGAGTGPENAQTHSPASTLPSQDVIIMGGDWNYPPYAYLENKEPAGFDVEIARAAAQAAGLEVRIVLGPWADIRHQLDTGEIDAIIGMAYSAERDALYDYSLSTTQVYFDIFVPSGSDIQSADDLADKRVVVQEGGLMHDYLLEKGLASEIITVSNVPDALLTLSMGNGDCALLNRMQGLYFIKKYHMSRIYALGQNLYTSPYSFAVKAGNTELLNALNNGLAIIKTTGEYQQLYEKWFGVHERQNFIRQNGYLVWTLGVLVFMLAVFILWSRVLQRQVNIRTAELARSEEKYRLLVENASEAITVICDGKLVFANSRIYNLTGYPPEQLAHHSLWNIIHPDDRAIVIDRYERRISGEDILSQYPIRIITADGATRYVLIQSVRIEWEGRLAALSLYTDITDRVLAEKELERQLSRLDALRAVDMAILSSEALPIVLSALLENLSSQLQVDAADILMLNETESTLEWVAGVGFNEYLTEEVALRYPLAPYFAGQVAMQKIPRLLVNLTATDPQMLLPPARSAGFVLYCALPLVAKGEVKGVMEIYHRKQIEMEADCLGFLRTMSDQAAIAIDNAILFASLQRTNQDLLEAYDATIRGWARALDLRNSEAGDHTRRLVNFTLNLASRLGIPIEQWEHIRRGVILHDIGKMAVPDEILLKPGPLTPEEWEVMRRHPQYAHDWMSHIPFLQPAMDIPYGHHERWDGSGYPLGLKGEEIPLAARIFAVVDVWDALTHDRVYHSAWAHNEALTYLETNSGKLFDPQVIDVFIQYLEEETRAQSAGAAKQPQQESED